MLQLFAAHHFITKPQGNFLKDLKEELKENELKILLDFTENYSFIVQNAVQGYHWNNSQATLHLIIAYYKENPKKITVKLQIHINVTMSPLRSSKVLF